MKNTLPIGLAAAGLLLPLAISAGTPVNPTPPLGLPALFIPEANPLTQEKIDLGRKLFMDRRLSHNNVMSCAMCHVPEQGFTSHELGAAIGLQGRSLRRNSPAIYNVGYQRSLFHEGRELHLEDQVWAPLLAKNEMNMPSIGYVVEKVKMMPEYKGRFEAAFGGEATAERIGFALASYQRAMVSGNSRFDGDSTCSAAREAASPAIPSARSTPSSPTTSSTTRDTAGNAAWRRKRSFIKYSLRRGCSWT
ncbi:MAG: hypothetical protein ABS92_00205 [Thiobacillus sp. SCN 63-374]|nr:MAG: hypothetical protein ABS92_00205 [Thiobacillus sp. SCN 63-374]